MVTSASVGLENKITGYDHPDRESGSDGERRGDVELPPDDLLACVVDRVLAAVADRLDQPVVIIGGQFGADAQERRETGGLGEIPPVIGVTSRFVRQTTILWT